MNFDTFHHSRAGGWSIPAFPRLNSQRTLVLAFGAPNHRDDPGPIGELLDAYPDSHVIGCSTSGEIVGATLHDDALSVAVARFQHTDIASAVAPVRSAADSRAAGETLGHQLSRPNLRAVLVFSDGLRVNGSELVAGLNAVLPESVIVTGGLAGDGDRFQRTWSLRNGPPRESLIVAAGLYGSRVRVGHGSKGGWDLFGPERRVTRAEGNVLFEIDGRPALELYKEYLGERAGGLPATALLFPIALRRSADDDTVLVRTVLGVNDDAGSMTFAGDIPEGSMITLMRANFDRIIEASGDSALHARSTQGGEAPSLCLAISCVGRRLVLGERAEEELEACMEILPPGSRQVGFYSYGEISPFASGRCDLHNQTMTLTTIAEE